MCNVQVLFQTVGSVHCQLVVTFASVSLIVICRYIFLSYIRDNHSVEHREPHISRPNCSFDAFRQIAKSRAAGYLPGHGTWKRNSSGHLHRFQPSLCNLQHGMTIPGDEVKDCLRRQNVRYIVVLGDSNGRRYCIALHEQLSQLPGVQCTPLSRHLRVNWTTYEQNDTYIVHRCTCGRTTSGRCTIDFGPPRLHASLHQARCRIDASAERPQFSVAVEYATVYNTLGKIPRKESFARQTGCQPSRQDRIVPSTSDTYQQFFLAEFFSDPRPDLIIVFANAHDRMPLRHLVSTVDAFAQMVDRYIRPPTRIIWMSRTAEDVRRKPTKWRTMRYEHGTMTRLEWLNAANKIMYRRIRRRFLHTKKWLLFPDLLQMSKPVLDDCNLDGVHMKPEWYRHVMSYILQAMCAEH